MLSPSYINYLSNQAAVKSVLNAEGQANLIEPYEIRDLYEINTFESTHQVPFPNLGALRPEGWKLVDDFMVDKSGFGRESEPALTFRGLIARLRENLTKGRRAYAIIEEGQFQVVLGEFEPDPDSHLHLDRAIDVDDWESLADDFGFESGEELRAYCNL